MINCKTNKKTEEISCLCYKWFKGARISAAHEYGLWQSCVLCVGERDLHQVVVMAFLTLHEASAHHLIIQFFTILHLPLVKIHLAL